MESIRAFLFILFLFLTFLLYQEWEKEHAPEKVVKASVESSLESYQPSSELTPTSTSQALSSTDSGTNNDTYDLSSELPALEEGSIKKQITIAKAPPIVVITNTLKVVISPLGGNMVSAELINYKESLDETSDPINILENRDGRVFLALSGLYGEGAPDFNKNIPVYQSEQTQYQLDAREEKLTVDLNWTNSLGVEYVKRFTFYADQYVVDVEYFVNNLSSRKIPNRMFTALRRDLKPVEGQEESGLGMRSYLGPAYYTEEDKYEKYEFDDLQETNLEKSTKNGWVAILQHYFVTAWIPSQNELNIIDTSYKAQGNSEIMQIRLTQKEWQWIEPGEIKTFKAKLYVGPKIQSELKSIAPGLDFTVDYGFLWWIGQPIFYLLIFFQSFAINWGLAIILVTIAI